MLQNFGLFLWIQPFFPVDVGIGTKIKHEMWENDCLHQILSVHALLYDLVVVLNCLSCNFNLCACFNEVPHVAYVIWWIISFTFIFLWTHVTFDIYLDPLCDLCNPAYALSSTCSLIRQVSLSRRRFNFSSTDKFNAESCVSIVAV